MDLYSRMVAILKIFLPLAALGILSTLFLLSREGTSTVAIPFAEDEVSNRVQSQLVTSPFYSGTTSSGNEITVTAETASPGGKDTPAMAEGLKARITSTDGARINLSSDQGSLAMGDDTAVFQGNVVIHTTTGYRLTTDELHASLSGVEGSSPGQVVGTSPMGDLTAGRMEMSSKNRGGTIHLHFNDGVKLIYDPQKAEQ